MAAIVAFIVLPPPAMAAPADDLLALVPPDTAICLVVRDLRGHLRAFAASPMAGWIRESEFGKLFADPAAVEKVRALQAVFADQLGVTGDELIDDVIGDAVVFAYQPGPPGQPDRERGLILVRARKPAILAKVVEGVNSLQQKSGEIRAVRDKTYHDRRYVEREKSAGGREYYLLDDGILAFSGQEEAIRGVIDRPTGAPGPVADGLSRLGLSTALAACWFNPRAFDAELRSHSETAKDAGERAFLAQFRQVWAATDGVAVYARAGRGLELGLAAAVDRTKLPPEVRDTFTPTGAGSDLWAAVPPDAALAVGGRVNVPKLLAAVSSFLPADGQAGLKAALDQGLGPLVGKDKLPAVLAGLGPDWVFWVAPPTGSDTWVPTWAAALKVPGGPKGEVSRLVLQAVDYGVQTVRLAYNQGHADQIGLTDEASDGVVVKTLVNEKGFPPGFRPSYALKQGYLVVAGSPEQVRRFAAPTVGRGADNPPLLRFSADHLRRYLLAHRAELAAALGKWSHRPTATVEAELTNLTAVLEALDRMEVRSDGGNGVPRLSLHIEFAKPLAK